MFCNSLSCWHSHREHRLQCCHLNDRNWYLSVKIRRKYSEILAALHSTVYVELFKTAAMRWLCVIQPSFSRSLLPWCLMLQKQTAYMLCCSHQDGGTPPWNLRAAWAGNTDSWYGSLAPSAPYQAIAFICLHFLSAMCRDLPGLSVLGRNCQWNASFFFLRKLQKLANHFIKNFYWVSHLEK